MFSEWEYLWSRKSTDLGEFKYKKVYQSKLGEEGFQKVEKDKEDNHNWPLFDYPLMLDM